jgi:hypothetical protein
MEQRKLPKRMEEYNSNPYTESRKKPKNRRKLTTNIFDELVYILEEINLLPNQQYGLKKIDPPPKF